MAKKNVNSSGEPETEKSLAPPVAKKIITEYSHLGEAGEVKPKSKEIEKKFQKIKDTLAKQYGEDILFSASEAMIPTLPIPTGLSGLDDASGIGGIGNNIIIEFFGLEGVGKSYAAQKAVAQAQRQFQDKYCLYVDVECGLDEKRMRSIGIELSQLKIVKFTYAERLFEQLENELIPSELFSIVVVDSLATLITKAELDGLITDQQPALLARVLSKSLKRLLPLCRKHNTTLIFINQLREKIGTQSFQKVEDTPGGRAARHSYGMRVKFDKYYGDLPYQIKNHAGEVIGQRVSVKFIKNRCGPPFKEGMFELYFSEPDLISEVIRKAKKAKLWRISKGVSIYVAKDGEEYKENNEKEFVDMLIANDFVYEMAERILEKQASGEVGELLPASFTLQKLRTAIDHKCDETTDEDNTLDIEL